MENVIKHLTEAGFKSDSRGYSLTWEDVGNRLRVYVYKYSAKLALHWSLTTPAGFLWDQIEDFPAGGSPSQTLLGMVVKLKSRLAKAGGIISDPVMDKLIELESRLGGREEPSSPAVRTSEPKDDLSLLRGLFNELGRLLGREPRTAACFPGPAEPASGKVPLPAEGLAQSGRLVKRLDK